MTRAIYLKAGGGYDNVFLGNQDIPDPMNDEVKIRLHASSLNYHDYAVVSGVWGPSEQRIPMADGAGEVIKVGGAVKDLKVGDRVCTTFFPSWLDGKPNVQGFETVPGDGIDGYARELVNLKTAALTLAPDQWTHEQSATLTTAGLTAWRALFEDYDLTEKHTVLIQGTGGVSIFALQFAKSIGAKVIATSSSDEKIKKLKTLGADYCINYKKNSKWSEEVLSFTKGQGVDHVIEVGGPETLGESINSVKVAGHISVIGILSGLQGNLDFVNALLKQVTLQGVLVGSRTHQERMITYINKTKLFPIIDRVFELEDIVSAFQYQETNQHFGKICLKI
jgi:NADPH:quinone reductase-like Zn-dependent oxidoreductase